MEDAPPRKPWGAGRVAFLARLDAITAEIAQGLPLTAIYETHRAALGIGYPSFVKLVGRYANGARVTRRRTRTVEETPSPTTPPAAPAPPPALPLPEKGSSDARHEPVAPRTFTYDGNPRADDYERYVTGTARKPES